MATAQLHQALKGLRGQMGNLIFRQFRGQTVISRAPDYSRRRRTARQKASSRQFGKAVRYADAVLKDAVRRAASERGARRAGKTLRGFLIAEYFKQQRLGR